MALKDGLYKKIHVSRFKVGLAATVLIAAGFLAMFLGFYKVSRGFQGSIDFSGYNLIQSPVDVDSDGCAEVIGYTGRELEEASDGSIRGMNADHGIALIDLLDGMHAWAGGVFTLGEPNYVVGCAMPMNRWDAAYSYKPRLLVQFAQVNPNQETRYEFNGYGDMNSKVTVIKNETGLYRTLIMNVSNSMETIELDDVPGRILDVFPLNYQESDAFPDFLVITTNVTYNQEWSRNNTYQGFYGFHVVAYFENGTLAWSCNNTDVSPSSLLNAGEKNGWPFAMAFSLNQTHFVMKGPGAYIVCGDIQSGNRTWSSSGHDVNLVFDSLVDVSGDGLVDIPFLVDNGTTWFGYYDLNGTFISSHGMVNLGTGSQVIPGMYTRRDFAADDVIVVYKRENCSLYPFVDAYKHNSSGLSLIWRYEFENHEDLQIFSSGQDFFLDDDAGGGGGSGRYFLLRYKVEGRNDRAVALDAMSGSVVGQYNRIGRTNVIGDFLSDDCQLFMEIVFTDNRNGLFVIGGEGSKYIFQHSVLNTWVFYLCIGLVVASGILTALFSRIHRRLLSMEEKMVAGQSDSPGDTILTTSKTTRGLRKASITMLAIIIAVVSLFIYAIFFIDMGGITVYGGTDYTAIRNAYLTVSLMLASTPLLSLIYNVSSPNSAMLYVRIQKFYYRFVNRGKKEHRIVVLDMSHYARKFSNMLIISRSLFPIFISLTLGLSVFQTFSRETITNEFGNFNLFWLADFEFYGGLIFIGTYIFLAFIVPGGWLLDDSGVVYFDEPKSIHHPGDISKISSWLLNWLKGLAGFTALFNYYKLFANFNIIEALQMESVVSTITIAIIIIVLIILSPILYGLLAMFASNADMIDDLEYNREILYGKLQKMGIDTTPMRLRDFFTR
ncbi:MAG: hypothetical protein ACTSUE_11725 [Promethearchaeota archaeon]